MCDTMAAYFNPHQLKANPKVHHMLVRELLYTEDCALIACSEVDAQVLIDCFHKAIGTTWYMYGLLMPTKKTEVLLQPKPGACYKEPVMIGLDNLKAVTKFCYLGGALSNNIICSVYSEITVRIAKASLTFGHACCFKIMEHP